MRALRLLALVVLLAPVASAQGDPLCIIFVEPEEDFSTIRMRADLILDEAARDEIAFAVDADASRDITSDEVAAYERSRDQAFSGAGDMAERILYLDGNSARELRVTVKLTNWTGPIATARNGTVTEHREYDLGLQPYDYEHAISGGLGAHPYRIPKPVVEVVVINAPEGWLVTSVSQSATASNNVTTGPTTDPRYGGNLFQGSNRTVSISGFDLHSSYVMIFRDETPTYPDTTPGFETLAVSAAALVALIILARRRRSTR